MSLLTVALDVLTVVGAVVVCTVAALLAGWGLGAADAALTDAWRRRVSK